MNARKIQHPQSRHDLISYIKDLSDFEMQKREWCVPKNNPKAPHVFWDNADFCFDMLIREGDLDKLEYALGKVGYWFRSKTEALKAHELGKLLRRLVLNVGMDQPNDTYLNSPLWQEVVKSAKEVYDMLMVDEDLDELVKQEKMRK